MNHPVSAGIGHDAAASLLQVSPETLTRLVASGAVRRHGPGRYQPAQIIRDYIAHLSAAEARLDGIRSQQELAEHLDMSERNLRDVLAVLDIDHKRVAQAAIRVAYIRHLRETAAGRGTGAGGLDLAQERAALAREQRLGIEIRNATLRGQYASITLLAETLATASQAVAERFEQLPATLRKACPELNASQMDVIMATLATARNEWVRRTADLAAAKISAADVDDPAADAADLEDADAGAD